MIKIKIKYKSHWLKYHFGIIAFFLFTSFYAQEIKFTASAPKAIENGEQFALIYSLNENGSGFEVPKLDDFEFLSGPSTSQSSSISMINGKVSKSVKEEYTLYFKAVKEGTFTIPPATIKVGKKTYKSNALTIEVVKATSNTLPSREQQQNQSQQQNTASNDDLFMQITTDKKTAYVGEQIVATVKLFSRYRIDGNETPKMPSYKGFYKQDIETKSQLIEERINGTVYLTAVLERVILFPQQSGKLTIDPASINLVLLQRVRSNFGYQYQRFTQNVISNDVAINVKPLPANKPSDFKGAVGSFSLNGSVNKTEAKTNDAISFKIVLKGKGNIKLIEPPKLSLPPDFETFEPKTSINISNSIAGQSGTKTFEYLTIPRYAGEFTVEPITLTYFDPSSGSFKQLKTPKFYLEISKGDDTISGPVVVGVSKEDIQFLGSDIRYIKTKTRLKNPEERFFGSILYYIIFPTLLIIMALIIVIRRKQIQKNKNIWLVKNRKANKLAGKRLKLAQSHLKNGQSEAFYEEMAKALWGYIADKLSIPIANLSREKAGELLMDKQLSEDIINEYLKIIEECEFARYAPASEATAMKDQYQKAVEIISNIEQKI